MFCENLKTMRKAKGYTQEELAIKLNVVRQTVSKWEKGVSPNKRILRNNLCLPACKNIIFQLGRDTTRLS